MKTLDEIKAELSAADAELKQAADLDRQAADAKAAALAAQQQAQTATANALAAHADANAQAQAIIADVQAYFGQAQPAAQ